MYRIKTKDVLDISMKLFYHTRGKDTSEKVAKKKYNHGRQRKGAKT
jgi:hypothetical protein